MRGHTKGWQAASDDLTSVVQARVDLRGAAEARVDLRGAAEARVDLRVAAEARVDLRVAAAAQLALHCKRGHAHTSRRLLYAHSGHTHTIHRHRASIYLLVLFAFVRYSFQPARGGGYDHSIILELAGGQQRLHRRIFWCRRFR